MKLVAKYSLFSYAARHAANMKGARFDGANKSDFSDAETIHEINYYPFYFNTFPVEKPFRYYRYVSSGRMPYALADLHFYDGETPVQGKYFDQYQRDSVYFSALYDNDLMTSMKGTPTRFSWIGFDSGDTFVSTIRYVPVNDANCIISGHLYELCYWNNGQWITHGTQTATADYLEFNDVPQGALYWLKCLTEGTEERIFTYEVGIARWW